MRDCPHCSKGIPSGSQHCPACGARLEEGNEDLHETRPFQSHDRLGKLEGDFNDTMEQLPAIDMEITEASLEEESLIETPTDESLRETLIETPTDESLRETLREPPGEEALRATIIDPGPETDAEDRLGDTLVEVEATDAPVGPITFSELGQRRRVKPVDTGSRPLDFEQFTSGKEATRATAEIGSDDVRPAGGAIHVTASQIGSVRGVVRLTTVLAILTVLLWIATAALMIASFLAVPPVTRLLARLPFRLELLIAAPGVVLLATLLAATGAQHRVRLLLGRSSRPRIFLRLLLWFLLASLPGIGLLLGLGGGLYLIMRKRPWHDALPPDTSPTAIHAGYDMGTTDRPMGWTLLFFTLAWQDIAAVMVLTHFRTYLPWI